MVCSYADFNWRFLFLMISIPKIYHSFLATFVLVVQTIHTLALSYFISVLFLKPLYHYILSLFTYIIWIDLKIILYSNSFQQFSSRFTLVYLQFSLAIYLIVFSNALLNCLYQLFILRLAVYTDSLHLIVIT